MTRAKATHQIHRPSSYLGRNTGIYWRESTMCPVENDHALLVLEGMMNMNEYYPFLRRVNGE